MDKLEMAVELIRQAQNERKRLEGMNKELEKVGWKWEDRVKVYEKYSPTPHKSVINDSLKMARRLIMEEYIK